MKSINGWNPVTIVAEIGCNHKGDIETARTMIKTASEFCNATYAKFQKRNVKELLSEEEYHAPHPVRHNSYGQTYGEHRENLEFTVEEHGQLQKWCREFSIGYSCSVWDCTSAREIISLKPDHIKVPSACNLNFPLINILCEEFTGDIHIALGMTTPQEIEEIVTFLDGKNCLSRTVLYACTSGYPVAFKDVCLLEIKKLSKAYGHRIKNIGFSGHHLGIAVDMAATVLGATWIERHFTLDRTWKGTDHAASLEPDGLRKLARDSAHIIESLSEKSSHILDVEMATRKKLKVPIRKM